MMNDLTILKERLANGVTDELLNDFEKFIQEHPTCDEAYFYRGNAFRRLERWGEAMNSYQQAMELNPESPAKLAYQAIVEVLDFYNKDMFNQ